MPVKVSEYIAQRLADHRVKHIFAISGAGNSHLLDSFAYHPDLKYICPHHEQAAVMAAIAYSRLSGRLGVALTTAGPGAANAITGVLNAWADSIPVLVIAGQEKAVHVAASNPLRMYGVQGFNFARTVEGMTKYAAVVDDPSMARYHLEKALLMATAGRPGPVWLDIPVDVQGALIEPEQLQTWCSRK